MQIDQLILTSSEMVLPVLHGFKTTAVESADGPRWLSLWRYANLHHSDS